MQAEMKRIAANSQLSREEVRELIADAIRQQTRAGIQPGELKPSDSLRLRGEDERRAVKALLARFRRLAPEEQAQLPALLNGLGKLQVGIGDFDAARESFAEAAWATPDQAARAEARYNAYRAALEARRWDDALAAVTEAASLDPDRFEPFPLHRYRPLRILGAGGFGTAFLCHDDNLDEEVVVKTLHAADIERGVGDLIREVRLLRKLNHPAVIRVLDADYADGRSRARPYFVMEHFPGVSLEEYLKQGRMAVADLVAVARQVAQAMQAAHRLVPQQVIHRDLKPDNILVRRSEAGWEVRVIDFGLAMRRDALEAAAGLSSGKSITAESIAGTLKYAPPEQKGELSGEVPGPCSDVYAFGKTCCQALFLTPQPNRRLLTTVPPELADLLEKCIEYRPADRFQGFDEVLTALDAVRLGSTGDSPQQGDVRPVAMPPQEPGPSAPESRPPGSKEGQGPRPVETPVPVGPKSVPTPASQPAPGLTRFACVSCYTLLKSAKPVPWDGDLQCPRCRNKLFPGYFLRLQDEIKVYEQQFSPGKLKVAHIAPHTLEVAAMWAVLTRLETPKDTSLTWMQKLRLYNGSPIPGYTDDHLHQLYAAEGSPQEGTFGVGPGEVTDQIHGVIAKLRDAGETCLTPLRLLSELEKRLPDLAAGDRGLLLQYRDLLNVVREEYADVLKDEVQRVIVADEDALARLWAIYRENVRGYTQHEKVRNRYTGHYYDPDESLMRSVEECIDIPEGHKDVFRRQVMYWIGTMAVAGKPIEYRTFSGLQEAEAVSWWPPPGTQFDTIRKLRDALKGKLVKDLMEDIKQVVLAADGVDRATQGGFKLIKSRLTRDFGYCEVCSADLLTFVASREATGRKAARDRHTDGAAQHGQAARSDAAPASVLPADNQSRPATKVHGPPGTTDARIPWTIAEQHVSLAKEHLKKDEADRAIAEATRALQLDATCSAAYITRARALVQKGDFQRAVTDADRAVQLAPEDPEAYVTRAYAYLKKGDRSKAIADAKAALRLAPNHKLASAVLTMAGEEFDISLLDEGLDGEEFDISLLDEGLDDEGPGGSRPCSTPTW